MSENLFEEFSPSSLQEWKEKIKIDLKGKEYDSITSVTEEGILIEPVYHADTIKNQVPFPFKKANNNWSINQAISFNSPKEGNKIALQALASGVNSLTFNGEISNLEESKILLENIMLDIIEVFFITSSKSTLYISEYINAEYKTKEISGGFEISDTLENTQNLYSAENFKLFNIDAFRLHTKGANASEEIAFALSEGVEKIELLSSHYDIVTAFKKIKFTLGSSTSYFLEIAKIRAFKLLWSNIAGAYKSEYKNSFIHVKTSPLYHSKLDENNNILRNTTQAMSSILAGCDTLTVTPHSVESNSDFTNRIAKNIQLILQEESYFNKISDPSEGSYYIEYLTQELCSKAWKMFQEIESKGGFSKLKSSGELDTILQHSLNKKKEALTSKTRKMIGVNYHQNPEDKFDISSQSDIERLSESFEKEFNTSIA